MQGINIAPHKAGMEREWKKNAFIQSTLQYRVTFTHSYTDGGADHAR